MMHQPAEQAPAPQANTEIPAFQNTPCEELQVVLANGRVCTYTALLLGNTVMNQRPTPLCANLHVYYLGLLEVILCKGLPVQREIREVRYIWSRESTSLKSADVGKPSLTRSIRSRFM